MPVMRTAVRRRRLTGVVVVWCVILAAVGFAHKRLSRDERQASARVLLDHPLSTLPMRIGVWEGIDVPMDRRVLEVAGSDDYVNRRYIDPISGQFVDFHLAYTARPANMLGHRPSVCYPAQGWRNEEQRVVRVRLADGGEIDCLRHRFIREQPDYEGLVVLNYYILQGRPTADWTDFWGPKWRRRNLTNDPNFYVAQVQVASPVLVPALFERGEQTVQRFAEAVGPLVRKVLPGGESERYAAGAGTSDDPIETSPQAATAPPIDP